MTTPRTPELSAEDMQRPQSMLNWLCTKRVPTVLMRHAQHDWLSQC